MISRRHAVAGGVTAALGGCASVPGPDVLEDFAALERRAGGRLGVAVLDTRDGAMVGWRTGERFGMCSTFKLPLAAAVLREIDAGRLARDQVVPYGAGDMVFHAPVTGPGLEKGGLSVITLAEAVQVTSDNVAANLLLRLLGGPAAFTAHLRALGDPVTRLDRLEPAMNLVPPGEVRDTTSPEAMTRLCARLLLGDDALSPQARAELVGWMIATKTGLKRLRAGFPADWRAGDKTGTADHESMPNKVNDVAVAWPPGRAPMLVTAFYESPGAFSGTRDIDQAVLAEAGRIAAAWISRR